MVDVAIIGGGVAAAAAVIALKDLRDRSIRVLSPPASEVEKIGESLSPSANRILKKLGVWDAFISQGHRQSAASFSAWGSGQITERPAMANLEGPGWQLDRVAFERLLWQCAGETALDRIDSTFGNARRNETDTAWEVTAGDGSEFEAGILIDCTGRGAVAARNLTGRKREDRQVAAFSFLEQEDPDVIPTVGSMVESRPGGWWYSALLPNGKMVVSFFSDPDLMPDRLHRDPGQWRSLIEESEFTLRRIETAGFAIRGSAEMADASTRWLVETTGKNWAAAGDAAAAFDPLSSHGMTTALWSGRKAALAAARTLEGEPEALSEYESQFREGIEQFRIQRRQIYGMERRFSDELFWKRRQEGG